MDVPDRGLTPFGRREVEPDQAHLEDVCAIRISGLKRNRPGRICDPRAVDEKLIATAVGHAVQEGNAAGIDHWLSRHCHPVTGTSRWGAGARADTCFIAGDLSPLQASDGKDLVLA